MWPPMHLPHPVAPLPCPPLNPNKLMNEAMSEGIETQKPGEGASPRVDEPVRITINRMWLHESECHICGEKLYGCQQGIPMYEGTPVPHGWDGEWFGCDACKSCFDKYERGELDMWKAGDLRHVQDQTDEPLPLAQEPSKTKGDL